MSDIGQASSLSLVLISLMKSIVSQESDPGLWQSLLSVQARVRDSVGVLGLELVLDESEGFAYLRQSLSEETQPPLPRLVPRRQLGFPVSLLLALLRKKLAEFDATSGDTRLILERDQIVDLIRLFLPATANEARLIDQIDSHIAKVVEMGFLRRLRGTGDQFEVRRILKAFVDGQWLAELDARLKGYRDHAEAGDETAGDAR